MAASRRPEAVDLITAIRQEAPRFEFFQAVRLVEWAALRAGRSGAIGTSTAPDEECVRFGTITGLSFPASAIAEAQATPLRRSGPADVAPASFSEDNNDAAAPAERDGASGDAAEARAVTTREPEPLRMHLRTAFMGLTGPQGVLPHPFSSLVIEQHRANDPRLQVFLDFFNHRALSLFYRAWQKHRLAPSYERRRLSGLPLLSDPTCRGVLSLGGFGTEGLADRWAASDELLMFFSGDWSRRSRPADGLRRMASALLGAPVQIESFVGQWLQIPPGDRAMLRSPRPGTTPPQVGLNLVIGTETWSIHTRFAVVVGPRTLAEYRRLLPGSPALQSLAEVVRRYVGPELDFEVRLILKREEVPGARLGVGGAQLGWTSFMTAEPPPRDVVGARFEFTQIDYPAAYSAAAG